MGLLIGFMWVSEPPTLSDLRNHFAKRRADLETIIRMSNEDSHYSRIAPTFLDRDETSGQPGRYMEGDPKAGLSFPRWNAYRTIYKRNGIKLGVQRDATGDAFIMVDSEGLLNRGHATGYLFCVKLEATPVNDIRFQPCTLNQDEGSHKFDPIKREEGYSFRRLEGPWFAYDEGPS